MRVKYSEVFLVHKYLISLANIMVHFIVIFMGVFIFHIYEPSHTLDLPFDHLSYLRSIPEWPDGTELPSESRPVELFTWRRNKLLLDLSQCVLGHICYIKLAFALIQKTKCHCQQFSTVASGWQCCLSQPPYGFHCFETGHFRALCALVILELVQDDLHPRAVQIDPIGLATTWTSYRT